MSLGVGRDPCKLDIFNGVITWTFSVCSREGRRVHSQHGEQLPFQSASCLRCLGLNAHLQLAGGGLYTVFTGDIKTNKRNVLRALGVLPA